MHSVQSVTLRESIDKALVNNPDILATQAEKEAQKYNIQVAKGGYLPKINIKATTGKQYSKSINSPWGRLFTAPTTRYRHDIMLTVKQNLFNGYGTAYSVKKEKKQLESNGYNLESKKNKEGYQVASAFFGIRKYERLIRLANKMIKNYNVLLSNVRKNGTSEDEKLVIATLEELIAQKNGYEASLIVAKVKFESLVGKPEVNLSNPKLTLDYKNFNDLIKIAQQNSPSLMSVMAKEESKKAEYNKSKASFMPVVDITVDASRGLYTRFDGTMQNTAKALLVVSSNIFNGGIDKAKLNAQKAKLLAVKYHKQAEIKKLRIDLSMAYNNYLKHTSNAESYHKAYLQRKALTVQYIEQSAHKSMDYRSVIEEMEKYTDVKSKLIKSDESSDLATAKILSLLGKLA